MHKSPHIEKPIAPDGKGKRERELLERVEHGLFAAP
jgi:hypothetical protein